MLAAKGMPSVAARGFQAPSVVVSYTDDKDIQSGSKFLGLGLQTAAGVPLQCDEPADFRTFPHRTFRPRQAAQRRSHREDARRGLQPRDGGGLTEV